MLPSFIEFHLSESAFPWRAQGPSVAATVLEKSRQHGEWKGQLISAFNEPFLVSFAAESETFWIIYPVTEQFSERITHIRKGQGSSITEIRWWKFNMTQTEVTLLTWRSQAPAFDSAGFTSSSSELGAKGACWAYWGPLCPFLWLLWSPSWVQGFWWAWNRIWHLQESPSSWSHGSGTPQTFSGITLCLPLGSPHVGTSQKQGGSGPGKHWFYKYSRRGLILFQGQLWACGNLPQRTNTHPCYHSTSLSF